MVLVQHLPRHQLELSLYLALIGTGCLPVQSSMVEQYCNSCGHIHKPPLHELCKKKGRRSTHATTETDYISVTDIMDTYCAVQIHPVDRPKEGLAWDLGAGIKFYLDNRLSMGLASSPYIFTRVSNFIACCTVRMGGSSSS